MKKLLKIFMIALLSLSLVACSEESNEQTTKFAEGTYTGTATSFGNGELSATVTLSADKIEDITYVPGNDSEDRYAALDKMVENIISAQSTQVDTITDATVSTQGLLDAVNVALEEAGVDVTTLTPVIDDTITEDQTIEADVVVVGAGGAGMTSAITLAQQGLNVVVVEKGSIAGGNTSRATGGMNAAETSYQAEAGIEDSVELYIEDTMAGGYNLNNIDLVTVMAENSNEALEWLESIDTYLPEPGRAGGASVNRAHAPVDEEGKKIPVGSYLVQELSNELDTLGVNVVYDTEVNEVLLNDEGKAVGVVGVNNGAKVTVNAKAVIIATGGFGGDLDYVASINPDLEGFVTTNAPTITGDAIEFLGNINANFVDIDQIQIHPTVNQADGYLISESLRGSGAILLNTDGVRFTDELLTRDVVSANILAQDGQFAYLVVDSTMLEKSSTIAGYIEKGYMQEAADYQELADIMGVEVSVVEESMTKWATAVSTNEDVDFGRTGMDGYDSDLTTAPYYVATIAPGVHHTMGGVEINTNAEVIDVDGNVIEGLYAAGEVTGGVHGGNRLGGNAVTDIIVFGLIAGDSAAAYIQK